MKKTVVIFTAIFILPLLVFAGALIAVGMFSNPSSGLCGNSVAIAAQIKLGKLASSDDYFNQFAPGDRAKRQEIAQLIISIGKTRKLSDQTIKIAVATAIQESGLRNLPHRGALNDFDSEGVFQQRPSQGWGTSEQITNPVYATNKFYDALVAVKDRDIRPMIDVAIQVQRPNPFYYHRDWNWDNIASDIVSGAQGTGTKCADTKLPGSAVGSNVIGDDYPHKNMPIYTQNPGGYFYRECVDFVAWRLGQQNDGTISRSSYLGLGNAVTWKDNLVARGFKADTTPAVGAVMWWGAFAGDATMKSGKWGHVAIVSEVKADGSVTVEQYNAAPLEHAYSTMTLPKSYIDNGNIYFIHVADIKVT